MSGHTFHHARHELHGITVVVETHGPRTYVGRLDTQDERGVHLLNVSMHEAAADQPSLDAYLERTVKFGVRVDQKHLVVPTADVAKITPLGSLAG